MLSNEKVKVPFYYCKSTFLSRLIMTSNSLKTISVFLFLVYIETLVNSLKIKSWMGGFLCLKTLKIMRKHWISYICFCVFEMWLLTCLAPNVTEDFSEEYVCHAKSHFCNDSKQQGKKSHAITFWLAIECEIHEH